MLNALLPLCTGHSGDILQLEALASAAHAGAIPSASCRSSALPAAAQNLAYMRCTFFRIARHISSGSMCPLPCRTLTSFADERLRRWHAWSSLAPQAFRKYFSGMRKLLFQFRAGEPVSATCCHCEHVIGHQRRGKIIMSPVDCSTQEASKLHPKAGEAVVIVQCIRYWLAVAVCHRAPV